MATGKIPGVGDLLPSRRPLRENLFRTSRGSFRGYQDVRGGAVAGGRVDDRGEMVLIGGRRTDPGRSLAVAEVGLRVKSGLGLEVDKVGGGGSATRTEFVSGDAETVTTGSDGPITPVDSSMLLGK